MKEIVNNCYQQEMNLIKMHLRQSKRPYRTCFQHDMAHGYFKDLARRTAFDKIFCNKAFSIAKI